MRDAAGGAPGAIEELGPTHRIQFRVGGLSVQVTGADRAVVALVSALEPFRVQARRSDIHIRARWVDQVSPSAGLRLFDSGSIWRLYESEGGFQFDFSAPMLGHLPYKRLRVDEGFRRANLDMSEEAFTAFPTLASLDYPLDELLIMHRLTQEKAIELHGCGIVGPDCSGTLFVGHSGAGKSTTARLWTSREGVEVLSDDRIIVRRGDRGSTEEVPCESAGAVEHKGILRLRDCSASRISHFAQDDSETKSDDKIFMYGTPWHGEAAFASPASAPLARICILEHGRGNKLTGLSSSQAVAELFARSFVPFHRHEYLESALAFLQDVVDAVPVYRYAFEPGLPAVDTILNLHD